jgi:SRSO17 transposase
VLLTMASNKDSKRLVWVPRKAPVPLIVVRKRGSKQRVWEQLKGPAPVEQTVKIDLPAEVAVGAVAKKLSRALPNGF